MSTGYLAGKKCGGHDDDDPARRGLAAAALLPPGGNPSFATIIKVAKALGLKLHFDSVA